ncbi:hypothetical protein JG687_00008787, partial [Phytophthora cactorum]
MRSESQGSYGPHYVQATLGFEKDHSSDEDFTPGGEVGADEEDASETDTPNVKPDGEDVKTLADARASPKQITNFLNKRIGEESEFGKKEAGKTKMHKLLFERWGETLAMDFTHGTNHLGYHL